MEKEKSESRKSEFDGININPKRGKDEDFTDYKDRQKYVQRVIKQYLRGRPVANK